jgi:predicted metal-binding membrane protein
MTNTLSHVELSREHAVPERGFLAVSASLFIGSTTATVAWCNAMPAMSEMPTAWMPMCGQTWWSFAASFIGMWTVMMVAMMLPSLLPMLRRYRVALRLAGKQNVDALTALAGAGYFAVWALIGVIVFALGAALAQLEMTWPVLAHAAPVAGGAVVLAAGTLQFSAWKARQLMRCRAVPALDGIAWRYGLRLGVRCASACAGLTAILLATGVMDLRAMAAVSAAITLERLAPAGERMARCIGAVAIGAGLLLMLRAALP